MDTFVMENVQLSTLLECGEALENCIEILELDGVPGNLHDVMKARKVLIELSKVFNLKVGTRFSMVEFERCPACGKKEQEHWLIPVWQCPRE